MPEKGVTFHPIFLKEPVKPEDSGRISVADLILDNYEIHERDVIIVTSKIVSILEGRCLRLDKVTPSKKSKKIAAVYEKNPSLIELIRREGRVLFVAPFGKLLKKKRYEEIHRSLATPGLTDAEWDTLMDFACTYRWGVKKFGFIADNAGIDCQNVPDGYAVLLPENPRESAVAIRKEIREKTGKDTAVIITDSFGMGSLMGNFDLPIGYSGIDPIERNWGRIDVFGRLGTGGFGNLIIPITSMAGAIMGGSDEGTPITVMRGFAYKNERPEDIGKDILTIPFSYQLEGLFWTIIESFRYLFVWLRA